MLAAGVACAVRVVVMVAARLGVIGERTVKQCLHRRVRAAAHAAVKPDAGFGECRLRAAANAAADDHIGVIRHEKARQRAVAAAVRGHDGRRRDGTVGHVVELECLRAAKVLKNVSVFIRNCNAHKKWLLSAVSCLQHTAVSPEMQVCRSGRAPRTASRARPGQKEKDQKAMENCRYKTFLFSAPGVVTMTVSGVMISAPFAVAAPWNICSTMALNVATTGPSATCSAVPRI